MQIRISFSSVAVVGALLAFSNCCLAAAKPQTHPIINASDNYVLGGTIGGKWAKDQAISAQMKGGEEYRLYSMTNYLGKTAGTKPIPEEPGEYPYVKVKRDLTGKADVFGIAGSWNALPRVPRKQSVSLPVYRDAVAAILKAKGIADPKVNITQAVRVDLEGDGQDEVLVSATTPNPDYARIPGMKKGDYSVVILRTIVKGKVKNILLAGDYYPKDEIYTTPNAYRVSAVLDVNGDGIQEILIGWHYYEGQGTGVISIKGERADVVLDGGSGA